jgi:hypothetical protein
LCRPTCRRIRSLRQVARTAASGSSRATDDPLSGDEQHLYLVESHAAGDVRAVRAVRTADGVSVPIADCVDCYNHKLRILGRCLLSSEVGANDAVQLRFYDVLAGKDLWKKAFPAKSIVLESAIPELTAVAAPDGTVTVVDLAAHRELLALKIDPKDLNLLMRGMVLRDRSHYYVALQTQLGPGAVAIGDPNLAFSVPVKATEVNGMIYAFDRSTGEMRWTSRAESQMLLLDHFEESPILLLTAVQQRPMPGAPAGNQISVSCTRSIEKRTGKVLYREEVVNNPDPFYAYEFDARTGAVDLISTAMRLRHIVESAASSPEHKGG